MDESERIDPAHQSKRNTFRTIGPIVLGIGVLSLIIGLADFISSMGTMRVPYFFFVGAFGALLIPIGLGLTSMGYMGAMTRYQAGEMAPVAKDTTNYMADGIRPAIKSVTSAVVEGIVEAGKPQFCTQCGVRNDADAKFCKACGTPQA